jgi:hypothetical protein
LSASKALLALFAITGYAGRRLAGVPSEARL